MAAHLPSQFSLTTNPRRSTEQPLEHHFAKVVYGEFRKKLQAAVSLRAKIRRLSELRIRSAGHSQPDQAERLGRRDSTF